MKERGECDLGRGGDRRSRSRPANTATFLLRCAPLTHSNTCYTSSLILGLGVSPMRRREFITIVTARPWRGRSRRARSRANVCGASACSILSLPTIRGHRRAMGHFCKAFNKPAGPMGEMWRSRPVGREVIPIAFAPTRRNWSRSGRTSSRPPAAARWRRCNKRLARCRSYLHKSLIRLTPASSRACRALAATPPARQDLPQLPVIVSDQISVDVARMNFRSSLPPPPGVHPPPPPRLAPPPHAHPGRPPLSITMTSQPPRLQLCKKSRLLAQFWYALPRALYHLGLCLGLTLRQHIRARPAESLRYNFAGPSRA